MADLLKKGIQMILVANPQEFEIERRILDALVCPLLRQFVLDEFNIDFVMLDADATIPGLVNPTKSIPESIECMMDCFKDSNGPSVLVLMGEKIKGPTAPSSISRDDYQEILSNLKSKNHPGWVVFQNKYKEGSGTMLHLEFNNLSAEENESIVSAIQFAMNMSIENGSRTAETTVQYTQSYFEQMLRMCTKTRNQVDKSLSMIRRIKNREELIKSGNSGYLLEEKIRYLDVDSKAQVRPEAMKKMDELRDLLLRRLPKGNSFSFTIPTSVLRSITSKQIARLRSKFEEAIAATQGTDPSTIGSQLLHETRSEFLSHEQYIIQVAVNLYFLLRFHAIRIFKKTEFISNSLLVEVTIHRNLFDCIDELPAANWLGREREMKIVDGYLTSNVTSPGLFFGDMGTGKSCLLAYARQRVNNNNNNNNSQVNKNANSTTPLILLRRCGHSASSSTLQLLLTSLTHEIAYYHRWNVDRSCEYATCVYDFWRALKRATVKRPIVLLLDDVELLYPQSHVELFRWLPHKLPPNVKVLLTTASEAVQAGFRRRYDDSSTITVPGLDITTLLKNFPNLMNERGKMMDDFTRQAANILLQQNTSPMYMRLLSTVLPHLDGEKLPDKSRILFGVKISQWEMELQEPWILKYCLCFLSLSRFGLSLCELVDLLSLENTALQESGILLKEVDYIRVPAYKVLSVLKNNSVREFLITITLDNRTLYCLKSETYRQGVAEYYQLAKETGIQLRQSMSDYWLGRFGGGRLKPMVDKQMDSSVIGVGGVGGGGVGGGVGGGGAEETNKTLNLDRLTTLQPYYWRPLMDKIAFHSNARKLTELHLLLLRGERLNDLFRYVLFSFDFMYSKLMTTTANDLISELYFIRQAYEVKNNQEVDVLITLLRHLAPLIETDPTILGVELAGRLTHLVGRHQQLTVLHQQIDTQAPRVNCLLPSIPCYPLVEAEALQVSLGTTSVGILVALSPDNRFLSTLQPSVDSDVIVTVWEAKSVTKSQIVNIGTHKSLLFKRMFYMPQRDEYLVVEFVDNVNKQAGYLLINLDMGLIENKISLPQAQGIKLLSTAKSYLIVQISGSPRVYQHSTGQIVKELNDLPWPFIITPSDKYIVATRNRQVSLPSLNNQSNNDTTTTTRGGSQQQRNVDNSLRLINLSNGEALCSLELQQSAICMLSNVRNEVLFVGCRGQGLLCRYDINQVSKRDVRKLKPSMELSLDSATAQAFLTGETLHVYSRLKGATQVSHMLLSPDDKYLLALYDISDMRRFYLVWHLANKSVVCMIPKRENDTVRFSGDMNQVYQFLPIADKGENSCVLLFNLTSSSSSNNSSGSGSSSMEQITLVSNTRDIYLLKGGIFVTVTDENITLTTLKHMEEQLIKSSSSELVQSYSTALISPQYNRELNVIYSNDLQTSDFSYFNLDSNLLFTVDMSHSFTSMTKNPMERYISPDGTKLIMVYGSRHSEQMKKRSRASPSDFLLPINSQGNMINDATAYRKPEIPNVNYFTGTMNAAKAKKLQTTVSLRVSSDITQKMFEQRILRVFDLNTCSLVCQISLTGERVLQLTNKVLLTFKPDYASITRSPTSNANDIVSIYDVRTGLFVNSLYLEHPVVASGLVAGNTKMIVSCGKNGKWLKLLGGSEHFDKILHELDIEVMMKWYDEFGRSVIVKDMLIFRNCDTSVLLNYTWKETDLGFYYAKIDMLKKDVESHFEAESKICDITGDGMLAVDQMLNIYDLNRGECIRNISASLNTEISAMVTSLPYGSIAGGGGPPSAPNKQAKFTDDGLFVVVVDNGNRQLTVLHNDVKAELLGKALLHPVKTKRNAPNEWENYAVSLGQGGRIIVLHNTTEFKVFIFKDLSGVRRISESVYKNLRDRVRYLMPHKTYNTIDKAFKNLSTSQTEEGGVAGGGAAAAGGVGGGGDGSEGKSDSRNNKLKSRRDGGQSRDSGIVSPVPRRTAEIGGF